MIIDLNDFSLIDAEIDTFPNACRVNFIGEKDSPYYRLLDEYPSLTTPSFTPKEVKHGARHYIPTSGCPVQSRARRLHPDKLALANAEIENLCKLGVCRRAKSEWSSPLLIADKPGGGHRVCGDYRSLTCLTEDDKYLVKNILDFKADLAGKNRYDRSRFASELSGYSADVISVAAPRRLFYPRRLG